METTQYSEIFLDSGKPYTLWRDESSCEIKKGAVIDTLICSNPSCRDVHITAVYIDERFQDITMQGGKLSYSLKGDNKEKLSSPLKSASFSVNIDTLNIEPSKELPHKVNDPELFAWVSQKIVSKEHIELLRRRWRRQKGEDDDQWRERDWSWWKEGDKIPYYEAFPDTTPFIVPYNKQQFLIREYYCVTPGCQCKDITLSISYVDQEPITADGSIDIDSSTLEPISFESISISRSTLQNILKKFCGTYDLKPTFQERRKKMKAIGKELFKMGKGRTQVNLKEGFKKIGRNQPCPCGSGKKYKKCCLRK